MSDDLVELPVVFHYEGCDCFTSNTFICGHCDDEVGWCCGADDQVERETGIDLCDPCANYFVKYKERTGRYPTDERAETKTRACEIRSTSS